MGFVKATCKQCDYNFGETELDFGNEVCQHALNDHDGYCEISVGVVE